MFLSSSYAEFQQLPSIQETINSPAQPKAPSRTRGDSKSPEGGLGFLYLCHYGRKRFREGLTDYCNDELIVGCAFCL